MYPAVAPESVTIEQQASGMPVEDSLFTRCSGNPILSRRDWPYSVNSVFNAGAVILADGDTLLLCRIFALLAPRMASMDGASMRNRP
jgi:hypothetical protein